MKSNGESERWAGYSGDYSSRPSSNQNASGLTHTKIEATQLQKDNMNNQNTNTNKPKKFRKCLSAV